MDDVVVSVHPIAEALALVVAACLGNRHDAYPMVLTQDALGGEAAGMRVDQLPGGIVHFLLWETRYWVNLRQKIEFPILFTVQCIANTIHNIVALRLCPVTMAIITVT